MKTVVQTALASIGTAAVLSTVDWRKDYSMANNEEIARIRYVIENAGTIDLVYDENGRLLSISEIFSSG